MWQFIVQPNQNTLLECLICILWLSPRWKSFWELLNIHCWRLQRHLADRVPEDGWDRCEEEEWASEETWSWAAAVGVLRFCCSCIFFYFPSHHLEVLQHFIHGLTLCLPVPKWLWPMIIFLVLNSVMNTERITNSLPPETLFNKRMTANFWSFCGGGNRKVLRQVNKLTCEPGQ